MNIKSIKSNSTCPFITFGTQAAEQLRDARLTRRVDHEGECFETPRRPVDLGIAAASDFAVVIVDVAVKKHMQNPQANFPKDDDCLNFQWAGVVFWALVFIRIRIRTQHAC